MSCTNNKEYHFENFTITADTLGEAIEEFITENGYVTSIAVYECIMGYSWRKTNE